MFCIPTTVSLCFQGRLACGLSLSVPLVILYPKPACSTRRAPDRYMLWKTVQPFWPSSAHLLRMTCNTLYLTANTSKGCRIASCIPVSLPLTSSYPGLNKWQAVVPATVLRTQVLCRAASVKTLHLPQRCPIIRPEPRFCSRRCTVGEALISTQAECTLGGFNTLDCW
jgi:hypothetical protein